MASKVEEALRKNRRLGRTVPLPTLGPMEGAAGFRNVLGGLAETGAWPVFRPAAVPGTLPNAVPPPELPQNVMQSAQPVQMPRPAGRPSGPAAVPRPMSRGSGEPLQATPFPQRGAARAAPLVAETSPGSSYGLEQYGQSDPTSNKFAEAFERSKAAARNTPTVLPEAPPPAAGGYDVWKDPLPTGKQYPFLYGPVDPEIGQAPGDPLPGWIGRGPRAFMNTIAAAGNLVPAAGNAALQAVRPMWTPESVLEKERKAEGKEEGEEQAEEPKTFHITPRESQYTPPGQAPAAAAPREVPTVLGMKPGAVQEPAERAPAAGAQAPVPARTGAATPVPGAPAPAPLATPGSSLRADQQVAGMPQPQAAPQPAPDDMFERGLAQIGRQETGGQPDPYRTIGVKVRHKVQGQMIDDYALGKYGIMESNLPSWSTEAFGYPVTREEFLADEQLQEDLARFKFGQYWQMGTPADAASRWLTGRPLREAGNDADFWGSTGESYANEFLSGIGQEGLPVEQQAFQQGYGPATPNPVDQSVPPAPDFSQQDRWLNQAEPRPYDPAAQRQMQFNAILSGIAERNAGVNVQGAGGTGRLLAALGAGAATGKATGAEQARLENENWKRSQEGYFMDRARFAGDQQTQQQRFLEQKSDIDFRNQSADQVAAHQTNIDRYGIDVANELRASEAGQANRENIGAYLERARTAGQPSIEINTRGIFQIMPDGQGVNILHEFATAGADGSQSKVEQQIANGDFGPELQNDYFQAKRWNTGDETGLKQNIINNVLASGHGPQVFEGNYEEAVDEATKIILRENPAYQSTPEKYQGRFNQVLSGVLYYNSVQAANEGAGEGWILRAAGMGDKWAQQLIRGDQ